MNKNGHNETRKYFGKIFLPQQQDKPVMDVWLMLDDNSITLEVPRYFSDDDYWDIIHGEFTGMDKVTFVSCYAGGSSTGMGGTHGGIHVSYIIKDAHFNSKEDLIFDKVHLTCPALTHWVIEKKSIETTDFKTFTLPDTIEVCKSIIRNVTISFNVWYPYSYSRKKLDAKKECYVAISSDKALNIDTLSEFMRQTKKFILFLTDKNPEYSVYHLFKEEQVLKEEEVFEEKVFELVNTTDSLREDRFSQGIHIGYFDVQDTLGPALEKWFELKELYPVIDFLLERHYNTDISSHGFFTSICAAIEIYEGNKVDKTINATTIKNKKRILSSIDDDTLRQWFLNKTHSWDRPRMEKLQEFKPTITELIKDIFNLTPDEFIIKVIDTRNGIVHRGVYKDSFTSTELFLVTKILEFSLKLRILELTGLENTKRPDTFLKSAKSAIRILARLNKIKP